MTSSIAFFLQPGEFHEGGVWRVLVDDPAAQLGVTPLSTIQPGFRLVSNRTGCVLAPGVSKYPEWSVGMRAEGTAG